ncbi:hypothetical protein GUJ93_ZPchr0286g2799 [Zizania palustris]|uniref:STICHEL DnaA-N-like alpha-beta domain-containing protein n=1 Tax=Zizania palustris TaxID=103762 RepID=A0A8J5SVU2_ZIZPA|nr:hypothetical protein GUJ93_ZPchr0286g2799 [Zizania palustris]
MLAKEARLISVSLGTAPTVQLMFHSHVNKSKAERSREQILHAFEYVLSSVITLEIRYEPKDDAIEERSDEIVWGSSDFDITRSRKHSSRRKNVNNEHGRQNSIVRGKVSLAHVINKADTCSQQGGWSRQKAMSIAEKLEKENLRMEPRSSLLCWKASSTTRRKLSALKIRTRRSRALSRLHPSMNVESV